MIYNTVKDLHRFFVGNRRSGTSSLIKEISNTNDIYVLVPHMEDTKEFGDCAIPLSKIKKYLEVKPKPILVDNHTMLKLLEMVVSKIDSLDNENQSKSRLLHNLKREIDSYETKNGKL